MRRTKQWWASLTKEERSELHHLDYANSPWLNRDNDTQFECSHCGEFHISYRWICFKCQNRRNELVKKANENPNSQS